MSNTQTKHDQSFDAFYSEYLAEHRKASTRVSHVVGTVGLFALLVLAVVTMTWWWVLLGIAVAYGFAWSGHLFLERNRPKTFSRPLYSVFGDFRMTFELLTGQRRFRELPADS